MSEIRSQATPARDEAKRETLARLGMIHLSERYGTRLRLEPSHDNEIRVDITHSGGTESHFPDALDLLESVEAVVEHMGLRKPRTVNSAAELDALPMFTVIRSEQGSAWERQYGALGKPLWIEATQTRGFPHTSDEITLPATVLFTPGDAG